MIADARRCARPPPPTAKQITCLEFPSLLAGQLTFRQFYEDWSERQLWLPATRANADLATGSVPFADLPMKSVRRSHVETWVKGAAAEWAPTTVRPGS